MKLDGLTRVIEEIKQLNWTKNLRSGTIDSIRHNFPKDHATLAKDYETLSPRRKEIFEMFEQGSPFRAITEGDENISTMVYYLVTQKNDLILYS